MGAHASSTSEAWVTHRQTTLPAACVALPWPHWLGAKVADQPEIEIHNNKTTNDVKFAIVVFSPEDHV